MHLTITPAQYKKLNEMGRKGGGSIPLVPRGAAICSLDAGDDRLDVGWRGIVGRRGRTCLEWVTLQHIGKIGVCEGEVRHVCPSEEKTCVLAMVCVWCCLRARVWGPRGHMHVVYFKKNCDFF